jgi:hypothetical protein
MEAYFVLDECGEPRRERDLDAWTRWFERADRSIARTAVTREVMVLTTFRGVGEVSEPGGEPLLFETRVFGGLLDGEEIRRCTRAEAIAAHATLAQLCRIANAPDLGVNEQIA